LANRRLFKELLEADLARTQRGGQPLAVAYLDLDDFKNVNDTFGHEAGDKVLCETANRLLSVVRGADVVARLGGDEFVIVYEPNDPSADKLIERIEDALAEPVHINGSTSVTCPASVGVADTRSAGYYGATLLAAADAAMYQVKRDRQQASAP
jgi:diguanylate cyclase (GGDEF)-like protein